MKQLKIFRFPCIFIAAALMFYCSSDGGGPLESIGGVSSSSDGAGSNSSSSFGGASSSSDGAGSISSSSFGGVSSSDGVLSSSSSSSVNFCGTEVYDPSAESCCGTSKYALETQFCYQSSKIGDKCGGRAEVFDPDLYECREIGKIYLKAPVSYGGDSYDAVLIGDQTWLARNLNFASPGSMCGSASSLVSDNTSVCDDYGRLYDWEAAVTACPSGWRLPSNADWDALYLFADPAYNKDAQEGGSWGYSEIAGKHLKKADGWEPYSGIENLDTYGFAALPGGSGNGSSFGNTSYGGYWWSFSEGDVNYAYYQLMYYLNEFANWYSYDDELYFFSVRCIQD